MESSAKRPWVAALLGTVATGLGHLYLRKWGRALWWVALLVATGVLFVPEAAFDALVSGVAVPSVLATGPAALRSVLAADAVALWPVAAIGALSVLDAYLLARAHNAARVTVAPDGSLTQCPNCGGDLDADLDFCHWCTAEFGDFRVVAPGDDRD